MRGKKDKFDDEDLVYHCVLLDFSFVKLLRLQLGYDLTVEVVSKTVIRR